MIDEIHLKGKNITNLQRKGVLSDQNTEKKMRMLYGKRASTHIFSEDFNFY
jgi:hypothetical protein